MMRNGAWRGPVRTASGGVLRHKVQAVVIAAVLFIATASAALGLALLDRRRPGQLGHPPGRRLGDAGRGGRPARGRPAGLMTTRDRVHEGAAARHLGRPRAPGHGIAGRVRGRAGHGQAEWRGR